MGTFIIGDTGCTSGGSLRIYQTIKAAADSGIVSPLVPGSAPDKALQALAYSVSKGIGDEVNADGGLGGSAGTIGIFTFSSSAEWDDVDSFVLRGPDLQVGVSSLKGFVALELMIESAASVASGTLVGTLPVGFRPPQGHRCFAVGDPLSVTPLDIRIDSSGNVVTYTAIPAFSYYYLSTLYRAN